MRKEKSKPVVLVVDDVPENIDVLAGALVEKYEVKVALNGDDALDIASSSPHPDLILLDIVMPGLDGYTVCRKLKESKITRDIPVIFVTAMGELEDEARGFDAGGVDYITKPIQTQIVLARVKAHLELTMAREQLKEQNRVLKENLRLREDVESIIRHDLKTPLNVIMWAPDILADEGNLTDSQLDTLSVVKQASFSMLKIINSSINLLKMERGEYQVHPVSVNILKSLIQIKSELQGLMRTKNLDLIILINGEVPEDGNKFIIEGEEILLYTLLANLIKNGVEASPRGEAVSILLTDDEQISIQIHNQGSVPEEIRDRFFDKFVSAKKTTGTGLGTYSARLIAEILGGTIGFDTSDENGTVVTVTFPSA